MTPPQSGQERSWCSHGSRKSQPGAPSPADSRLPRIGSYSKGFSLAMQRQTRGMTTPSWPWAPMEGGESSFSQTGAAKTRRPVFQGRTARSNWRAKKRREAWVQAGPSESSVSLLARGCHHPRASSLGIGCSSRVPTRFGIALLVQRSHLAVGPFTPALWFFLSGPRWSRLNSQSTPLFEFRLPPESCPASPSQPAAASQLLPWTLTPYSTSGTEGPLAAGFASPLRSALRV